MVQAKQIVRNLSSIVRLNGVSATGGSTVVTTPLTTLLSTSGDGGVSVPLQPSGASGVGVITTTTLNYCKVFNNTTKNDIVGTGNAEVYARITEAGGVYTTTYYTLQAGVETAHSFGSATTIDLLIPYRFDFGRYPADAAIAVPMRNVSDDASATAVPKTYTELLTPTGTNTIPNLTKTPDVVANLILYVNNIEYDSFGGANARFTLSGKTVTWDGTKGTPAFNIVTTDRVVAQYTSLE